MTNPRTDLIYVTYIRSTPDKVFAALTRPEITRQYWGHTNDSDWQPGSDWAHVRDNAERTVNIVGQVIEATPPSRLVLSWTGAAQKDHAESYSRVTFDIVEYDDMVRLTVSHENLIAGSGMANGVSRGWPIVLSSLKSLLETGQAIDIFAKPKAA